MIDDQTLQGALVPDELTAQDKPTGPPHRGLLVPDKLIRAGKQRARLAIRPRSDRAQRQRVTDLPTDLPTRAAGDGVGKSVGILAGSSLSAQAGARGQADVPASRAECGVWAVLSHPR